MSEHTPRLLTARFRGSAVGPGAIQVVHLLRFLGNLTKALQRTGLVLRGNTEGVRRGAPARTLREELALDLTLLTEGSPDAVLGFSRTTKAPGFASLDFGLEVMEKAIQGLAAVQAETHDATLPPGYDRGVLMAWRDAGVLFKQGIERIDLTLNHRSEPIVTTFTPNGHNRILERITGPRTKLGTLEGRLLMADFKEHGTRCRIHPAIEDPVLCLFGDDQKAEVLDNILQFVRVIGEIREDPVSGKATSIVIHDIERLEDHDDEDAGLLPKGTPVSWSFWESPTLDELAESQSVQPIQDVRALFGTWPGEADDGFEADIDVLRHRDSAQGQR